MLSSSIKGSFDQCYETVTKDSTNVPRRQDSFMCDDRNCLFTD